MAARLFRTLVRWLIIPMCLLIFFYSMIMLYTPPDSTNPIPSENLITSSIQNCNLFKGCWIFDDNRHPMYNETCPFHRNSWNCFKNKRDSMKKITSWKWVPDECDLPVIDPFDFMARMKNKRIGFVGDSLNENFVVSFLCILSIADVSAQKWKKQGAWRGAYFPKFNLTVAYHRAVLLAKYNWQPNESTVNNDDGLKGIHRVDVDIPADEWADITNFYDVLVFNTGHWWGSDKFPKEKPLIFFKKGKPINPPLDMHQGFKVVLENMISYIEKEFPKKTIKFWRLQSPRHFYGGDWNQNGSCLFDDPLDQSQVDIWFDPSQNGVNKESRTWNRIIRDSLRDHINFEILDLSELSEYRADAHPAIWLGKKDAVSVWGQDCMHWCLPGVPDTWVDILSQLILRKSQASLT